MTKPVRVRFAPSPTGPLHIGGVRTALFNYLFAKKNNGTFYIRIEDTDQNRFVEGAEQYILDSLKWLGISPDETIGVNEKFGPYKQSERKHLYKQYADELLAKGFAYYAFDTSEELDAQRKLAESEKKTFIYNHSTRDSLNNSLNLTKDEVTAKLEAGEHYVIRFKMPKDRIIQLKDIIRGDVQFDSNLLDDKVLFKSDGMPTYHLANIVDDHLQETSHVIRGEEWLPSLPLHYLLYEGLGWDAPEFAHLPLILKPVGNGKLSKRDGDKLGFPVFPLEWKTEESVSMGYKEQGFFPEAVVNFLALLGWNSGTDQEIFSLKELEETFDLARVNKSGAKFDPEKNKWFNHQYINTKSSKEMATFVQPILEAKGVKANTELLEKVIELNKERAFLLTDFYDLIDYYFIAPTEYDPKGIKKWNEDTVVYFKGAYSKINSLENFDTETIDSTIKTWIKEESLPMGKVLQPLRVAMVGAMKGPDLFEIISLIGKEECLNRLNIAIEFAKSK